MSFSAKRRISTVDRIATLRRLCAGMTGDTVRHCQSKGPGSRGFLLARPYPVAPLVLGAEERIIGGAQQVFKGSAVSREGGNPKR